MSGAKERSEDALTIGLSYAGTMVADSHHRERPLCAHFDLYGRGAVAICVLDQVAHHAAQQRPIASHHDRRAGHGALIVAGALLGGQRQHVDVLALVEAQAQSGGLFTEIFVMDARGLNVAQSTVTSDYWQGDEDKFTLSFGAGADAIHLGEIEQDESTQTFQSQVSVAVVDPATGAVIGAITAGVDLSML